MGNSRDRNGKRGTLKTIKDHRGYVITKDGKRVTVKNGCRIPSNFGVMYITNGTQEQAGDLCDDFLEREGNGK